MAVISLANVPDDLIKQAWESKNITAERIAGALGVSTKTLTEKIKEMGLPLRGTGRRSKSDPEEFKAMWEAGVCHESMTAYFGYASRKCVNERRRYLGLSPREKGFVPKISIDEYLENR